jgi:aminoglycoside 3-N-acetyltransferase
VRLNPKEDSMSETDVVQSTPFVRTTDSLRDDLVRIGLPRDGALLVHSSLSALGWVNGGPVTVIRALVSAIGPQATLVMPAHSGECSDPAVWQHPPVPQAWWQTIRDTMPVFDPLVTPTRGLGRIAELFRTWPGAMRSVHPAYSFSALGPLAATITAHHSLEFGLGENSPLGRLYECAAWVLLLGAEYDSNTCFHLAEVRIPSPKVLEEGSPAIESGRHVWKTRREVVLNSDVFAELGEAFESTGAVRVGKVGSATARLFQIRPAVDFAVEWLVRRQT